MRNSPHRVFLHGLALVFFIAFASLIPQIRGLIGSGGIQPAASYLHAAREQLGLERFWTLPTLAWIDSNDTFLLGLCWAGVAFSIALFAGLAPVLSLAALWILYLSVVNVGQDFL